MFVNKLDRERASFSRTLDELKDKFGAGVAPLQLPIGEEADFHGVVELLDDHAVHYVDGKATEGPIPPEMEMEEHSIHDALIEGIVVGDDDLMERYLADETIPVVGARARAGRRRGVGLGVPGAVRQRDQARSASTGSRSSSPRRARAPTATAGDGPPVAFVFKTIVDPYVGHVNLFKVLQGTVKADATLVNGRTMHDERLHQLSVLRGKEQESVSEVPAGDIAAVAKLADTTTGDVLGARGRRHRRRAVRAAGAGARGRDPGQVEERRGQARQRAAPSARRGPRAEARAQPRDPPDVALGSWARPTSASRWRGCTRSSASRSRPRT